MRKIFILLVAITSLISCKTTTEKCVDKLIEEEGYSYEEACDECEYIRDSEARYDRN
ncbi:MAG: hypothetical protein RSE15_01605 [Flavobacterium sp.]|uniref:hypothetical protein n=1 Tax=Flavobacterium sp. TaxID=239 RepID=UPI002B472BF8|nr:hypothetical protein [Flavobacterium sp.]WRH73538.1 MAG: hypothetical protein RSE15_01605 [Flavobacterium sp.]